MDSWSQPVLLALASITGVYLRGWRKLHQAFPGVLRPSRAVAFVAGVLVLLAVSGSPLAMLDHHYLTAHMGQHLLIMTVAVPLILWGAPVITLLQGLPGIFRSSRRYLLPRWPGRVLTHPIFCWLAGSGVVIGWHIPAIFQLGMRSELWHAVEELCFAGAGILFWWPVIQPWPTVPKWASWSVPVYLFLAALPCDALSAFLCLCNRVVYPYYLNAQVVQADALKDQACAGALMWVWVTFAYLFPAVAFTLRLLSSEKRLMEKQIV